MKALLAAKEAVLNLHYTDTRHKKTMTNMQEERQNTLLLYREVFIHVITEMTKLPSWGLYFYFKLDSILNVTLVSLCLFLSFLFFFLSFSLDS